MGEFSPPLFFLSPLLSAQTSNTSTRLWFSDIITKIHPPFQNPGSAPVSPQANYINSYLNRPLAQWSCSGPVGRNRDKNNANEDNLVKNPK